MLLSSVVCLWAAPGCDRTLVAAPLPSATAVRSALVQDVVAEGAFRARSSTPIAVPAEAEEGLRIAFLWEDGQAVEEGDVVVRFDDSVARRTLDEARAEREAALLRLEAERISVSGAVERRRRAAESAEHEREVAATFQNRDELIFSRKERLASALDGALAHARVDHAAASGQVEAAVGATRVDILALDLKAAEERMARAEKVLSLIELRAPHDGHFLATREWRGHVKQGDTVWPGQSIGSIPDSGALEAEVFVLESDAVGIVAGLAAVLQVAGHAGPGTVARVRSMDRMAKPRERSVPTQYFATLLDLGESPLPWMKPGQGVRAQISVDRGEGIVVPRQAVVEIDGRPFVHRRERGAWVPRAVSLGPATLGRIRIEEGLEEGDVVALARPTEGLTTSEPTP